ncbi:MAG: phospholipid carrier-dependent glycosyltransferase [Clostridia bacterium]|nr:phospholipid carrier-dependent glycosyltransferase [Clostridia bacterium]
MACRRWKQLFFLILLAAVALILFAACAEQEEPDLLYNGDFENLNEDGLPEGWFSDAYRLDPGYSVYSVTEGMDGPASHAALIRNTAMNDARFAQIVSVEPESVYCLSGYIRADGVEEGHGANLSVEGVYAFSEKLYDTGGEWQYIEYYGETGPDQYDLTVFLRVGGYSGESKGSAAFDHLSMRKVSTVPGEIYPDLWFRDESPLNEDDGEGGEYFTEEKTAQPAWPLLAAIGLIYPLIAAAYLYTHRREIGPDPAHDPRKKWVAAVPALLGALALRLVLCFFIEGYAVDVNCFLSWGSTMARSGPVQFYQQTSFCDYPPLYTYVLGINSWVSSALHAGAGGTRIVFRLLPCICDVAGCWLLLIFPKNRLTETRLYRGFILLLAYNPVSILNSAAWGQMDSVLCLLLLCTAVFAVEGKWIPCIAFYVTAVLVKPQALMLGFLGLAFMILSAKEDKGTLKKIISACLIGIALIAVYVIPFTLEQDPGWLIRQYSETLASYPYATVNTANLYYLLGGNWCKIESAAHWTAPVLLAVFCAVHGAVWYLRNRERKAAAAELAAALVFCAWFAGCAVLQTSWLWVGAGAMAYAFVIVLSMAVRYGKIRFLPYLGALLFILLYVFGIKMHERYLFPAFFLLMLAWAQQKDRRIIHLLLLFSMTVFVNEGIVLDNSIRLGSSMGHLNSDTVWLADILSVLNVIGALAAVWLGYELMKDRPPEAGHTLPGILPVRKVPAGRLPQDYRPDRKLHWNRWDSVLLCGITVLYSVLTLTTLGSTKAPQTFWSSSGEEEQIVFDLQKQHEDIRILYFGQVSYHDFTVAQSDDGVNWSEETDAQMNQGQCWKWKFVSEYYLNAKGEREYPSDVRYIRHFSGRYIRITSGQVGLKLNEIIFRDSEGAGIPASVVSRTGGNEDSELWSDPENLLDEQDSMERLPALFGQNQEGEILPSWWNGTYFDEIYHARTGFEFTRGTVPYETSHPPLGKVLISWCILLFGMTPFGWRFAGAMAGILMLPGIYLLAKQLIKKTWPAAFACALMALDCMHLTQTQIATIDSFPVLFIIFAFFFMLRFLQTDLRKSTIREALVPLAFSGLFMGLAIASKWIGIYAGAGLAVLYFWHCIRQLRMAHTDNPDGLREVLLKIIKLCLWCILFFIAVPAAVYLLSYLPYMAYNTRIRSFWDYVNAVWRSQVGMFEYHSKPGLGMDHPFYSPWWEWPIIGKPMYYASKEYLPADAPLQYSLFSFGNPVVWWGALGAVGVILYQWIREKHYQIEGTEERWHLRSLSWDPRYEFVLIGLLAQYLPWVLVPRGTYIYHYFASIPFLILMTALSLPEGSVKKNRIGWGIGIVFLAASAVFFILLLPYATGMAAPVEWLNIGRKILRIWY